MEGLVVSFSRSDTEEVAVKQITGLLFPCKPEMALNKNGLEINTIVVLDKPLTKLNYAECNLKSKVLKTYYQKA